MTISLAFQAALELQQLLLEKPNIIDVSLSKRTVTWRSSETGFEVIALSVLRGSLPDSSEVLAELFIDANGKIHPDAHNWSQEVLGLSRISIWCMRELTLNELANIIYADLNKIQKPVHTFVC